ncbi:MAG: signal recognition particle-docking protein FtsY [Deltaproteobacteria bacterium]|nr:signal recognition particle-docking protein FtsY [Deltaproteobacteria bacterium]
MEYSLTSILEAWAIRNPLLLALLLGPLALAVGGVIASAWRSRRRLATVPDRAVAARAAADPDGAIAAPAAEAIKPPQTARMRDRLGRTRESLVGRIGELFGGRTVDAPLLDELEALLFEADLGVQTADSLLAKVRSDAHGGDAAAVKGVLRDAILEKLRRVEPAAEVAVTGKPHVILVLGVNGAGKTTSIGKLAARHRAAGRSVILGAGDTFRAAAMEQLGIWGERVGCEVIAGPSGGDPSAVAFDTVKAAVARGIDVAIIDTAGRLQTKRPLMEELGKMVRVIGKGAADAPHEVLLVLDATTGQNAISQAQLFAEVAGVTGIVLTKLDGTAKGGVLIGLADALGIPVQFVGVGEAAEDLRAFSADEFVEALFDEEIDAESA